MVSMDGAKASPHKLVEKIRSLSDPVITSEKELRQCLKEYDSDMDDKLCDA